MFVVMIWQPPECTRKTKCPGGFPKIEGGGLSGRNGVNDVRLHSQQVGPIEVGYTGNSLWKEFVRTVDFIEGVFWGIVITVEALQICQTTYCAKRLL